MFLSRWLTRRVSLVRTTDWQFRPHAREYERPDRDGGAADQEGRQAGGDSQGVLSPRAPLQSLCACGLAILALALQASPLHHVQHMQLMHGGVCCAWCVVWCGSCRESKIRDKVRLRPDEVEIR
jgi:hypothetical protein